MIASFLDLLDQPGLLQDAFLGFLVQVRIHLAGDGNSALLFGVLELPEMGANRRERLSVRSGESSDVIRPIPPDPRITRTH
jgi:hypothetical protein